MPHKLDTIIHEEPELQVGGLERGQVFGGEVGVQVSGFDARELGQIVNHLLLGRDVVVDEGNTLARALSVGQKRRRGDCVIEVQMGTDVVNSKLKLQRKLSQLRLLPTPDHSATC